MCHNSVTRHIFYEILVYNFFFLRQCLCIALADQIGKKKAVSLGLVQMV